MRNQDLVKWELIGQAVWLVALIGTALIMLLQPVLGRVEIPVTGAGEQPPVSAQMIQPGE